MPNDRARLHHHQPHHPGRQTVFFSAFTEQSFRWFGSSLCPQILCKRNFHRHIIHRRRDFSRIFFLSIFNMAFSWRSIFTSALASWFLFFLLLLLPLHRTHEIYDSPRQWERLQRNVECECMENERAAYSPHHRIYRTFVNLLNVKNTHTHTVSTRRCMLICRFAATALKLTSRREWHTCKTKKVTLLRTTHCLRLQLERFAQKSFNSRLPASCYHSCQWKQ